MSKDDDNEIYWDIYLPESYEERRNMFLNENAQRYVVNDRLPVYDEEVLTKETHKSQETVHVIKSVKRSFDSCCDEKGDTIVECRKKRREIMIQNPKCPSCNKKFHMKVDSKRSPVMSMDCSHTICSECVATYIHFHELEVGRDVMITSCPVDKYDAQLSFRKDKQNFNLSLIEYWEKLGEIVCGKKAASLKSDS